MDIAEKQQTIVSEFQELDDWQDRYRKIISLGKRLEPLPEEHRTDKNKVKGCQSQVWLHAGLDGGRVHFVADSDAAIVRGLIALLLQVYNDHSPDEIIAAEPTFINEIGLVEHLTQQRSNGLSAMIKQLKFYAIAFKSLQDRMN